jgi:formylmethanofuran dehydrogenase subunit B
VPEDSLQHTAAPRLHHAVTCPFCGVLCDDLVVEERGGSLNALDNACPKARRAYARELPESTASIDGRSVPVAAALDAAARLLKRSRRPLFGGLGTDVDGARAALALAERCGAIVDHLHGAALAHNVRVLQTRGLATTTFAEVRNRADLVLLVGADINEDFNCFARRCLTPAEALVPERLARRRVVHLGPPGQAPRQAGLHPEQIDCATGELAAAVSSLRALVGGRELRGASGRAATQRLAALRALAATIAESEYVVFVWAPGQLGTDGDLVIGAVCDLVADLNRNRRAAGLSLGGNDGAQSMLATCSWQTGYPLRVSYAGDVLEYDPLRYATARLLARGEVDALLWISSFSATAPPESALPLVVLGTPGTPPRAASAAAPTVFLPVGTPGLDHPGQLIRSDGVVALPLPQLRARGLGAVGALLRELQNRMG